MAYMGMTYQDAGVNIAAGEAAVEKIKPAVARTRRPEVLGGLGGFAGLFALDVQKYPEPVLVSGTDGVGTKLRIAFQMNKHDTVGQDAVAMCVNDILVQGAEPLFFLDYIAVGKLDPQQVATVVCGIAAACEIAGCALIGGEMAEMPGFYQDEEYDIAGFAVGVVNRDRLIDGSRIRPGDRLLGLRSSGLHSNGYSLVRKIFAGQALETVFPELGAPLGDVLLTPTRIYVRPVRALLEQIDVPGLAHITGGGFTENLPRVLPAGCGLEIVTGSWPVPPIFELVQRLGQVEDREMYRTFNMGIGFVVIVHPEDEAQALAILREQGEDPCPIGSITAEGGTRFL